MLSRICFCFVICLISDVCMAQISGIAGTKLVTFNTVPLPNKTTEFEPTYNVSRSSGFWNDSGFIGEDTIAIASNLSWRITYGLSDKVELGMNYQSDVAFGNFDFKAQIKDGDLFKLGVMAGLGVPLGNRTYAHSNPSIDDVSNFSVGLIASYDIDTITSIDVNMQMTDYFRDAFETRIIPSPFPSMPDQIITTRQTGTTYNIAAEVGSYFLADGVQLVGGGGYYTTDIDGLWEAGLYGIGGIIFELYDRYVLNFGATYMVYGINQPRTLGLGFSFTTIWE